MPTKTGPKTLTKATTEVTTRLACIQSRGPCAREAKRNPKKASVLMKWKGLPAKESVIVSDHDAFDYDTIVRDAARVLDTRNRVPAAASNVERL